MKVFPELPNDVIYYILNFLNHQDRTAVLVAFSDEFSIREPLWKRNLNLSKCYFLEYQLSRKFLQAMPAPALKNFNVSHCYWLPADMLIEAIITMNQLEELVVYDTQITLIHLPRIFKSCPVVERISIGITHETWDQFQLDVTRLYDDDALEFLKGKFEQLTHLKLIGMDATSCRFWLLALRILGWCVKCVDLHLEPYYSSDYLDRTPSERIKHVTGPIKEARTFLFPNLKWMANIKSLVYTRRGNTAYKDRLIEELFNWIMNELDFTIIEHLWLNTVPGIHQWNKLLPRTLRSVKLGPELKTELYEQLTHVGGIRMPRPPNYFYVPALKFFHGSTSLEKNINEFCRLHPHIEQLVLDSTYGALGRDWSLPKLQLLSYACSTLHFSDLKTILIGCPNIDELHLKFFDHETVIPHDLPGLENLKKIRMEGKMDHLFFDFVFQKKKWNRLESLHISTQYLTLPDPFPVHFPAFTQPTGKLRDFRFQMRGNDLLQAVHILRSASQCPNLQRLVIYREEGSNFKKGLYLDADFIVHLVRSCKKLVALCLVDYFDPSSTEMVTKQLNEEIVPNRPSFWFCIDRKLPQPSQVPRIHYDEIVNPSSYLIIPPILYSTSQ